MRSTHEQRAVVTNDPRVVAARERLLEISPRHPLKIWRASREYLRLLERVTNEKLSEGVFDG